jgi:hypothetical protein
MAGQAKPVGELGTVRLAKRWSPVPIRAAVFLRRADGLGAKMDVQRPSGGRLVVGRELREEAKSLPPTISDPALLVLDAEDELHIVGVERRGFSMRPSREAAKWVACRARVRTRRGCGKNFLRIVEISGGSATVTLLAECLDPRQRRALELIEQATAARRAPALAG